MWLYSSPLEALVVVVITGTDRTVISYININSLILLKETRSCVCVFAKLDQFLPVRSQFDSNQHVNSVRTATFQSANFGPLLFAFYCPLLFYENKIKNE